MPRKKRKTYLNKTPQHYSFWVTTLQNEQHREQFLQKGDSRQKECIINTLEYMKAYDPDIFEEINGKEILKQFRGKKK